MQILYWLYILHCRKRQKSNLAWELVECLKVRKLLIIIGPLIFQTEWIILVWWIFQFKKALGMASFSNLHSQWITCILKSEISRGQIFFKSPKLKVVTEKVFFWVTFIFLTVIRFHARQAAEDKLWFLKDARSIGWCYCNIVTCIFLFI